MKKVAVIGLFLMMAGISNLVAVDQSVLDVVEKIKGFSEAQKTEFLSSEQWSETSNFALKAGEKKDPKVDFPTGWKGLTCKMMKDKGYKDQGFVTRACKAVGTFSGVSLSYINGVTKGKKLGTMGLMFDTVLRKLAQKLTIVIPGLSIIEAMIPDMEGVSIVDTPEGRGLQLFSDENQYWFAAALNDNFFKDKDRKEHVVFDWPEIKKKDGKEVVVVPENPDSDFESSDTLASSSDSSGFALLSVNE